MHTITGNKLEAEIVFYSPGVLIRTLSGSLDDCGRKILENIVNNFHQERKKLIRLFVVDALHEDYDPKGPFAHKFATPYEMICLLANLLLNDNSEESLSIWLGDRRPIIAAPEFRDSQFLIGSPATHNGVIPLRSTLFDKNIPDSFRVLMVKM